MDFATDMPQEPRAPSFRFSSSERAGAHGPDAAAFVLAGGQSSRMGRDKALLRFSDSPLIAHAIDILRAAGLEPSIAGARVLLESFAPVIPDAESGLGPLSGICAALQSSSARWAVFLPVDLPLLPASLIAYLLRRAQVTDSPVTVPSISGFQQTFPAVVNRAALPALQAELRAGRRGCFAAFQAAAAGFGLGVDAVPVELLVQSGQVAHPAGLPALYWFLNVNSPQDFQRAQALFSRTPCAAGT